MEALLISAAVALVVFLIFVVALPKSTTSEKDLRKRNFLERVRQDATDSPFRRDEPLMKTSDVFDNVTTPLGLLALKLPLGKSTYELLMKTGWGENIPRFWLYFFAGFVVVSLLMMRTPLAGPLGIVAAFFITLWFARKRLKGKLTKRNDQFVSQFPDAIDMIVRSVRSGHPLNTSFRMISDNMEPPIATEFRQVVDEVAYGRTLVEALVRLSHRIDEPDLNFFVVVLSVQQETGGNLAEVLGNLSNVIRKRKQLRLRIKAMTSEGRATGYVLGGLPVVVFGALFFLSPGYLDPLLYTTPGNIILGAAGFLIYMAQVIVKQMVNIDI
jgi:tight adherence protein B